MNMNKKLVNIIVFVVLLSFGTLAYAQITNPIGANDFPSLLANITKAAGGLIASIGVIMLIVAGIFYLTSAGSAERIGVAKKALIYAVVGIVIGLAADGIATAVSNAISGT